LSVNSVKEKLALGTVQFGLPYGINNKTGKLSKESVFDILELAENQNIYMLDSADAYGDAIQVIGSYLKVKPQKPFKIISKFIGDGLPLGPKLDATLDSLGKDHLYAYLYHRFDDYRAEENRNELLRLKQEKKITKIGVSIYDLTELEAVIRDADIDIIQIPLNPLDSSIDKLGLLGKAKSAGKEIHVRSVFLQGLLFKRPEDLTGNLAELSSSVARFERIVNRQHLTVRQTCLNYALHQPMVDFVIIGVDSTEQLKQNIDAVLPTFSPEVMAELQSISVVNRALLNPSNWKP
jgi:aryl-alcohol dehydrogenase-like predicted oxidoreductase